MGQVVICLMRGLITASLKVLGTYPNDNDELIIAKRGSMTSGSTSFSSLVMSGIDPQGIYSALFDVILQLAAAWLQFDL